MRVRGWWEGKRKCECREGQRLRAEYETTTPQLLPAEYTHIGTSERRTLCPCGGGKDKASPEAVALPLGCLVRIAKTSNFKRNSKSLSKASVP